MTERRDNHPSRRDILRWSAMTGAAVGTAAAHGATTEAPSHDAKVQSYRKLGRTGFEISDISFGSSRLRDGQEALVHHALDRGINYFDSAYGYTRGASETVLGKALQGTRDSVYLVSKVGTDADSPASYMMERLEASLRRLKTDYIDIYMCHAVNDVDRLKSEGWHEFIDKAKSQGKIRFTGVSGHAGYLIDCLDYALDEDMADVILAAYNFGQDPEFLAKLTRSFDMVAIQPDLPRIFRKAKEKNVGTVAMKTLQGARLNDMRPFETNGSTFAQAAFRWVLSNSDVDSLIVTMTSNGMVDEYLGASGADALAYGDMALLERYAIMQGATYCRHACNDCRGACPFGVDIADVLRTRMYATDYQDLEFARDEYAMIETNAEACLSCSGEPCRNACTHGIAIDQFCGPTHGMLA